MDSFDETLWKALANMRIAPAGAALTFEARLAREQGWTAEQTNQVMREYRRFLYLAATGPEAVTPSRMVDEAWHLHLTYTRHYWGVLCQEILPRPLHHEPTEGGRGEAKRFDVQYARTLDRYRTVFGEEPPADIWPSCHAQLQPVRRGGRVGLAVTGGAAMLLAACSAMAADGTVNGSAAEGMLPLIIAVTVAVVAALFFTIVVSAAAKAKRRKENDGCGGSGGGDYGDSSSDSDGASDGGSSCGGCGGGD